jgi:hypothetical protein
MKYFGKHLFMGLMIIALAGVMAFGKDKVKRVSITFANDLTVNGTTVKAGNYDVKFNEQTGELTIAKDGKVVAKTTARLRDRSAEARGTQFQLKDNALVSITFGGARQDVVIDSANNSNGNQ